MIQIYFDNGNRILIFATIEGCHLSSMLCSRSLDDFCYIGYRNQAQP